MGWMCKGLIPARCTRFFSSLEYPDWLWADRASYPLGTGSGLPGSKAAGAGMKLTARFQLVPILGMSGAAILPLPLYVYVA